MVVLSGELPTYWPSRFRYEPCREIGRGRETGEETSIEWESMRLFLSSIASSR